MQLLLRYEHKAWEGFARETKHNPIRSPERPIGHSWDEVPLLWWNRGSGGGGVGWE